MEKINKFTSLEKPILVCSIRSADIEYVINDIVQSEKEGAQGFLLHIELLDKQYRNFKSLKRIIDSATVPVMALNYRKSNEKISDEELTDVLIESVHAGAKAVDLFAEAFDADGLSSLDFTDKIFKTAMVKDITFRPECIEKQKAFIKKIHALDAEVLMSAHVGVELSCEQAVSLAEDIEERGADIIKIITSCKSDYQALEILKTDLVLKDKLKKPFLYQCNGVHGNFIRPIAPLFGSMMTLCHREYIESSNKEKPLLSDVKKLYDIISWRSETAK